MRFQITKIVFIILSIALLTQKLSVKSSQKAHVKLLESKQDLRLMWFYRSRLFHLQSK